MILFIICIIICLLFSIIIISSVIKKPLFWIQDFAPEVQKTYFELNPKLKIPEKEEATKLLIIKKVIVAVVCTFFLAVLVNLAGATNFYEAFFYSYIIWATVNVFDVVVLDLWLFTRWKKIRLPGTEHMDKAYRGNTKKHILDGLYGLVIGIPVCFLASLLFTLFN